MTSTALTVIEPKPAPRPRRGLIVGTAFGAMMALVLGLSAARAPIGSNSTEAKPSTTPAAAAARPARAAQTPVILNGTAATGSGSAASAAAAAIDAPYVIRSVLEVDGPLRHGDWYWDESGAPAKGPLLITVDLAAQTLSVFRGGHEIGVAVILYGVDDKPTPLGTFPISQKDADHVSNLYDAPMPYMLRLTNDGVAIHGTEVEQGYGTRGCIGVPNDFARRLFGIARLGDRVVITNGQTMAVGDGLTGA